MRRSHEIASLFVATAAIFGVLSVSTAEHSGPTNIGNDRYVFRTPEGLLQRGFAAWGPAVTGDPDRPLGELTIDNTIVGTTTGLGCLLVSGELRLDATGDVDLWFDGEAWGLREGNEPIPLDAASGPQVGTGDPDRRSELQGLEASYRELCGEVTDARYGGPIWLERRP